LEIIKLPRTSVVNNVELPTQNITKVKLVGKNGPQATLPKSWINKQVKVIVINTLVFLLLVSYIHAMAYAKNSIPSIGSIIFINNSAASDKQQQPAYNNATPLAASNDTDKQTDLNSKAKQSSGPDDDCQFHPELKKCESVNGKCPPGFGNNAYDHCFKLGPCPPGFAREDEDESGACKKLVIKSSYGFKVEGITVTML